MMDEAITFIKETCLNANTIIAVAALVIASVTSIVSIYQSILSRKQFDLNREQSILNREHNRLSVKPNLTTARFEDVLDTEYAIVIDIMNNGLGPAIIKDFKVFYGEDKKPLGSGDDSRALQAAIENILKKELPEECSSKKCGITINIFTKIYPFPSGESKTLLGIAIDKSFDPTPYRALMNKFHFKFEYESMYGEKIFPLDTRDDKANR